MRNFSDIKQFLWGRKAKINKRILFSLISGYVWTRPKIQTKLENNVLFVFFLVKDIFKKIL